MSFFAGLAVRGARWVVAGTVVFVAIGAVVGLPTPGLLGRASNDFVAVGSPSVRAEDTIERASGVSAAPQILVLVEQPTRARLARVAALVRAEPVFPVVAAPVRSRTGNEALVVAYARGGISQKLWRRGAERVATRLEGMRGVAAGGAALATAQVNARVQHDLTHAEELAFPVLFVLALVVFGGVVAAAMPLLCGILAILGSLLLLRGLDSLTPISTYALNIVTAAGLGLSIDYSLLLVSRYREELARTGPGPEAIRATLRTAGRTVAFSSVTVGAAVATLAVFPLGYLRSMGIAGGLVGPLAGLIALTVLPSLFWLLGPRVNALSLRRTRRPEEAGQGGWYRLAHWLMRRPVAIAVAGTVALVVATLPALSMRFTGIDASVLPPNVSSRIVSTAISESFPSAIATPAYAVVQGTAAQAQRYESRVRALPEAVATRPARRIGAGLWEIQVLSGRDSLAPSSKALVHRMRALPGHALVGGATAQFLDQEHTIGARLPLAIGLICVATLALLYLATRSLVLPLKALVMNALTLGATLGVIVFIFQDGRLQGLLSYRGQGALQLTQPVLVFAISFGLATDYGVFLLTRIKEAWDDGLPNREAVAVGLERTGPIITAAALLFCVAVGAFATSGVIVIKEVGIGIALAVAVDASIVRVLLVPSLMAILGRWNWWPHTTKGNA